MGIKRSQRGNKNKRAHFQVDSCIVLWLVLDAVATIEVELAEVRPFIIRC